MIAEAPMLLALDQQMRGGVLCVPNVVHKALSILEVVQGAFLF
jgi:hypothetical protein